MKGYFRLAAKPSMNLPGSIPQPIYSQQPMMPPMTTLELGVNPAGPGPQQSPFLHGAAVIQTQPGAANAPPAPPGAAIQWMAPPPHLPNCPPGLEYLTLIDQLIMRQHVSILEVMTTWEISNKYSIFNSAGQQVYFAYEESGCCERQCCGPMRGFTMHIVDNFNREVMRFTRPFKCLLCPCGCCAGAESCATEVTIESPPGQVISIVRQTFGCCKHNFSVMNSDESKDIFNIEGPGLCSFTYNCNCCADKVFEIKLPDSDQTIGTIRKKWSGVVLESFTNADTFTVEFPVDLDVRMKSALLGATFLILENCEDNPQKADCSLLDQCRGIENTAEVKTDPCLNVTMNVIKVHKKNRDIIVKKGELAKLEVDFEFYTQSTQEVLWSINKQPIPDLDVQTENCSELGAVVRHFNRKDLLVPYLEGIHEKATLQAIWNGGHSSLELKLKMKTMSAQDSAWLIPVVFWTIMAVVFIVGLIVIHRCVLRQQREFAKYAFAQAQSKTSTKASESESQRAIK